MGLGLALGMILAGATRTAIREVMDPLMWGVVALALILEMRRHQPLQYVLTTSGIACGAGFLTASWIGSGMMSIPGSMAAWVVASLGARGTARWILRHHAGRERYGWEVVTLSAVMASGVLGVATLPDRGTPGFWVPALILAVSAAVQLLATPWFLEKRTVLPVIRPGPAYLLAGAAVWGLVIRMALGR